MLKLTDLGLVVQPVYLDLHLAPECGPHVDNLSQVGQAGPDLTEEHGVVPHLKPRASSVSNLGE